MASSTTARSSGAWPTRSPTRDIDAGCRRSSRRTAGPGSRTLSPNSMRTSTGIWAAMRGGSRRLQDGVHRVAVLPADARWRAAHQGPECRNGARSGSWRCSEADAQHFWLLIVQYSHLHGGVFAEPGHPFCNRKTCAECRNLQSTSIDTTCNRTPATSSARCFELLVVVRMENDAHKLATVPVEACSADLGTSQKPVA